MSLALHLPALQVVLPLISAPLAVLLRRRDLAFWMVTAIRFCRSSSRG